MLFNSLHYLIFFPVVVALYFTTPHRFRWLLLLVASCYFYMVFIPEYILVLAVTICVDYFAAIAMEKSEGLRRKRLFLAGIAINLGMLAIFKYFNFVNSNLAGLAEMLGWNYPIENLAILLPIGLSFHTFQSISYLIEVYNERQPAERHFGYLSLFVMFFPQLVAGPIERPQHMLPQLKVEQSFNYDRIAEGLKWMTWGVFKKVVVADGLAALVNPIFASPHNYAGPAFAFAAFAFAIQIYCDFSGYSDIALGSAQVLGICLSRNFRHPYFSKSIAEFWQRWHITLSSWFRDYVFFPLRRSLLQRKNRLPDWATRAIPTLVTMFLSGLWHGANWTFILWGLLHGMYIAIWESMDALFKKRASPPSRMWSAVAGGFSMAVTFSLVSLALVIFRAQSITDAGYMLGNIFNGWDSFSTPLLAGFYGAIPLTDGVFTALESITSVSRGSILLMGVSLAILLFVEIKQEMGDFLSEINALHPIVRLLSYSSAIVIILGLGMYNTAEQVFIYFQF